MLAALADPTATQRDGNMAGALTPQALLQIWWHMLDKHLPSSNVERLEG